MKSSTPELMKFKRLQRMLRETRRGTIGLLEGMWLEVARNCPAGDIGQFSNEEIAIMCDWDGDPNEMVNALIECGWLDACKTHRLVVHDWQDHCPKYIKGNMNSHGKKFAIATPLEEAAKQPAIATPLEDTATKPSLVIPSQTKLDQVIPEGVPPKEPELFDRATPDPLPDEPDEFDTFVDVWNNLGMVRQCVAKNASRVTHFKARCKERVAGKPWLQAFYEDVKPKFPLPLCVSGNSWRPDIDWFLKPGSLISILEGKYDWRKDNGTHKTAAVGPGQVFHPDGGTPGSDIGSMY